MLQAHILYSGMVQGIGFRYTVHKSAVDFNICGWVKNLDDGQVEIVAEGTKVQIIELCMKIEDHFRGYIKNKEISYKKTGPQYSDFQVRF